MNIIKFTKQGKNKYRLLLENATEIILYENVILKHNLLITKNFTEEEINEINKDNYKESVYGMSLAYLSRRLLCKKELNDYLLKKDINKDLVKEIIDRINKEGYLNDQVYAKSFVHKQILTTLHGPLKIKESLINKEISQDAIEEAIIDFDNELIKKRIEKFITKTIKTNRNKSNYYLKNKIMISLINIGYDKESIMPFIANINSIDEEKVKQKEYNKLYKKLSRRYQGDELEYRIKQGLYQKGYRV